MMKKFGMIVGLIAVLMCAPAVAWAEASSVRVDAQEVPVNGNWFEYKMAEGEYVYCPIVIEDNGRLDVSVQINFEGSHYVGQPESPPMAHRSYYIRYWCNNWKIS